MLQYSPWSYLHDSTIPVFLQWHYGKKHTYRDFFLPPSNWLCLWTRDHALYVLFSLILVLYDKCLLFWALLCCSNESRSSEMQVFDKKQQQQTWKSATLFVSSNASCVYILLWGVLHSWPPCPLFFFGHIVKLPAEGVTAFEPTLKNLKLSSLEPCIKALIESRNRFVLVISQAEQKKCETSWIFFNGASWFNKMFLSRLQVLMGSLKCLLSPSLESIWFWTTKLLWKYILGLLGC